MQYSKTLIEENNVISLRRAYVHDNGNLVSFNLNPADLVSLFPKEKKQWAPKDFDWVSRDCVWVCRHLRSISEEKELMQAFPCIEHDLRPMKFERSPQFRLLWTDSGNSVALFLNEEPWAYIYEGTRQGYSKGILKPRKPHLSPIGKFWDQELFEKIFKDQIS